MAFNINKPLPEIPGDIPIQHVSAPRNASQTDTASTITSSSSTVPAAEKKKTNYLDTFCKVFTEGKIPPALGKKAIAKKLSSCFKNIVKKLDPNPELTKLDYKENGRYNAKDLANRLILKYKDSENTLLAFEALVAFDPRFNNEAPEHFKTDPKEMGTIRTILENHAKQQTSKYQNTDKPLDMEKINKLKKEIAKDLVGLVDRVDSRVETQAGKMLQVAGHVENDRFTHGRAVSADLGNSEKKLLELPNQAFIVSENLQGDTEVVLSRSARTNTESKIFDKSTADIEARLNTTTKNGLEQKQDENGDKYYTYCRSDVTLMDMSLIKSIGGTAESGAIGLFRQTKGKTGIPINDERRFVESKRKNAQKRWDKEGVLDTSIGRKYIKREVTYIENGQEKTATVREYEPLIFNFVFSSQAGKSVNVKQAREDNIPGALFLFKHLCNKHSTNPAFDKYQTMMKKEALSEYDRATLFFHLKTDIDEMGKKENLTADEKKLELALRGLLVTLTGSDKGRNYDNEHGADIQYILLNHLADYSGSPISVECKSGNDRTATAMALRCAMKEYEKNHGGQPFDPLFMLEDKGNTEFRALFTQFIFEFGAPNVIASRGLSDNDKVQLKTKTHPGFQKYINRNDKNIQDTFNIT